MASGWVEVVCTRSRVCSLRSSILCCWLTSNANHNVPQELDHPEFGHYAVKRALAVAFDKHAREREMTSVLLSTLYNEVELCARAGEAHAHALWDGNEQS